MTLHIADEFAPLQKVAVCHGISVPICEEYSSTDPQENKWGWVKWDKELLLNQQDVFFSTLQKYNVDLLEIKTQPKLLWQMYTRDVGFVIRENLYFANKRTLIARNGEIELLVEAVDVDKDHIKEIPGKIEGGDVLVDNGDAFVGISNRTNEEAIAELSKYVEVKSFYLGDDVMHLDTVLTLLPKNNALVCLEYFKAEDQAYLKSRFNLIPVTKEERLLLGTNVFVVNPETIFVEKSSKRVQEELSKVGFRIESVAYSEPIALGGSFRCTTLPLIRAF